jgi:LysM repeat protein
MAPVAAAGGVAVLILAGLLVGGVGVVANALEPAAPPAAIHASPVSGADAKNKTDGTGTSTAGPTTPPERVSAPTAERHTDTVYYIRGGDTLSQISRETGISVDRLAQYNAIPQVNLIYADSALRVPYVLIPGQESPAAPKK